MYCFTIWFLLYACLRCALSDALTSRVPSYWQLAPLALVLWLRLSSCPLTPMRWLILVVAYLPLYLLWRLRLWGGADLKFALLLLLLRGPGFLACSLLPASVCMLLFFLFFRVRSYYSIRSFPQHLPFLPAWTLSCTGLAVLADSSPLLLL